MVIEITPLDTLFFRNGKPFMMGVDTWADVIFPPPPSVIYGALRTLYFANHMDEFKKFFESKNEKDDPTKDLVIKGVYLKENSGGLMLHAPLDTVKRKKGKNKLYFLTPSEEKDCYSSLDTKLLLKSEENQLETVEKLYIEHDYLEYYLQGLKRNMYFSSLDSQIKIEPKVGIRIDRNRHTSEQGEFYRAGMIRLKDLSILVDYENLEGIPDTGIIKLGGEGKAASYRKVDDFSLPFTYKPCIRNKRFKLYLATPAIFRNGWLPGWLDEGLNGIKLKLIAAAVGKYITIGGFDIKERKPKTMYRAVPAGSVYYFEVPEGVDEQKLIDSFHNRCISEYEKEKGFGLAFMGVV
ncbi:MAG: type III-B CRISPR module-associated protein Cmr3 [Acetivibrionales bacterium]